MNLKKLKYFFVHLPRNALSVLGVVALIGCGGGQSDTSSTAAEPISAGSEQSKVSSALSSNSAPDNFDFSNYQTQVLDIDLAALGESMPGSVFVVKVIDLDANALFVGAYESLTRLNISVVVPKAHDSVFVELYSDSDGNGVVIEETFL